MTTEAELKALIRRLDTAFVEGRFDEVGQEMDTLETASMGPDLVVGWLSFSYAARRQLGEHRASYVGRAKVRLEATIGPERTSNILSRLG